MGRHETCPYSASFHGSSMFASFEDSFFKLAPYIRRTDLIDTIVTVSEVQPP
jgi:hypothetical protein